MKKPKIPIDELLGPEDPHRPGHRKPPLSNKQLMEKYGIKHERQIRRERKYAEEWIAAQGSTSAAMPVNESSSEHTGMLQFAGFDDVAADDQPDLFTWPAEPVPQPVAESVEQLSPDPIAARGGQREFPKIRRVDPLPPMTEIVPPLPSRPLRPEPTLMERIQGYLSYDRDSVVSSGPLIWTFVFAVIVIALFHYLR